MTSRSSPRSAKVRPYRWSYELGRQADAEQRNILDLVARHKNVMGSAALRSATEQQIDDFLHRSEEFLAEVLAPFEMMHRSFSDTIHQQQAVVSYQAFMPSSFQFWVPVGLAQVHSSRNLTGTVMLPETRAPLLSSTV